MKKIKYYQIPLTISGVMIIHYVLQGSIVFQYQWFCRPSAFLTQLAVGGEYFTAPTGEPQLFLAPLLIRITTACSGISFFLLLCATSLLTLIQRTSSKWWHFAALIPGSYVLTLIANSSRIASTYLLKTLLPPSLSPPYEVMHMTLGIALFLPVLLGSYVLLLKQNNKEIIRG